MNALSFFCVAGVCYRPSVVRSLRTTTPAEKGLCVVFTGVMCLLSLVGELS